MKNQPNKATVKDGLPTADSLIEDNLGGLELTMDDEMWKFYRHVIRQCMQSYSDQQNAELRERVKELEGLLEGVENLPPLTSIAGTLVKQCEKAKEALKQQ